MLDTKTDTFLCACRNMNFTKAAEELHITQSAVSQQIKSLEEYYQVTLFNYSNRSLTLTPAGIKLRTYLEAMSHDANRIREAMLNESENITLKIGTTMSVGDYVLPQKFANYMKEHPDTRLEVTRLDSEHIIKKLNHGILDFAFIEGYVDKNLFNVIPIKSDDLVIACGKDYDSSSINTINDLFNHRLLIREEGSGTREIFSRYLNEYGYSIDSFSNISVFNSPLLIAELLMYNIGISIIYKSVIIDKLKAGKLKEIPVKEFKISHEFSAIFRKDSLYCDRYSKIISDLVQN